MIKESSVTVSSSLQFQYFEACNQTAGGMITGMSCRNLNYQQSDTTINDKWSELPLCELTCRQKLKLNNIVLQDSKNTDKLKKRKFICNSNLIDQTVLLTGKNHFLFCFSTLKLLYPY